MIESLQEALIDFEGPVLIATHDRRLIRELPRRLWRLHEGHLAEVNRSCGTADSVILRDDFEGKVTLTRDEWAGILAKAKAGELD